MFNASFKPQVDSVLRGGNAPRRLIESNMNRVVHDGPPPIMPNNAPAHNYRAGVPHSDVATPVQRAFVRSKVEQMITGKGAATAEVAAWRGAMFSR